MAFADAIKYNRIRSMKGLPIGAIVPWASDQSTIPTGWVACNGATVPITRYPLLFDCIGTTYGGTAGSTFRIPPLTNSAKAVMDIFRGHYQHLKSNGGTAHAPDSSSIANDTFWTYVSSGDGNTPSNLQTTFISTVDIVGEINGSPQFFGIYDPITVSDGSFTYVAVWGETRLRASNMPSHTHSISTLGQSVSYRNSGGRASECTGTGSNDTCDFGCTSTLAWRVAQNPNNATAVSRGNNQTDLVNNFLFTISTASSGTFVGTGGGGTTTAVPPASSGGAGDNAAVIYSGGDGRCSGDMECGSNVLFTSLSNSETTLAAVSPHEHGVVTYNLQGRYRVISPGLIDDISLNTVRINNDAGRNFCTLTANTATPSLEMLYIIRAY